TYVVDHPGDQVTETTDPGIDTVLSSVTYTLADPNVENLTLTGSYAIDGTGNAGDNLLIGTVSNNVLDGQAGADTMKGGFGEDTYVVDSLGDVISSEDKNTGTRYGAEQDRLHTRAQSRESRVAVGGARGERQRARQPADRQRPEQRARWQGRRRHHGRR